MRSLSKSISTYIYIKNKCTLLLVLVLLRCRWNTSPMFDISPFVGVFYGGYFSSQCNKHSIKSFFSSKVCMEYYSFWEYASLNIFMSSGLFFDDNQILSVTLKLTLEHLGIRLWSLWSFIGIRKILLVLQMLLISLLQVIGKTFIWIFNFQLFIMLFQLRWQSYFQLYWHTCKPVISYLDANSIFYK